MRKQCGSLFTQFDVLKVRPIAGGGQFVITDIKTHVVGPDGFYSVRWLALNTCLVVVNQRITTAYRSRYNVE